MGIRAPSEKLLCYARLGVGLFDRPDQILDPLGMRTEIVGELVEVWICNLLEARLVDVPDDLDAHLLELGTGCMFKIEAALGLLDRDVAGGRHDPLLLLGREALPQLVAD